MPIKRYLSDSNLIRMKDDFGFLISLLSRYRGELDLALRDNYFNLYYKGNSLAKVIFKPLDTYEVLIHERFLENTSLKDDTMFNSQVKSGKYNRIKVTKNLLHHFFQQRYVRELCSKVKDVNYGEEINFEQMLITDNLSRDDIILIDRQITDTELKRKRMDLLALYHVKDNNYRFVVIEVKLGNNPELRKDVAEQLEKYINHIVANFAEYKHCYERHYQQKKQLGLILIPAFNTINIIKDVSGLVVVGGYSGIAKAPIKELETLYPKIEIRQFSYFL